jgi:UDP-N-acetyl-2-amino-2-deoxyglucuronate dehydrogenase
MIKFGIIGCGKIANRHANLLSNDEIKGAKLVSVYDASLEAAKSFSKEYAIDYAKSLDDFASNSNIDAISVLTPSGTHASIILELCKYGKPIIVEKPLSLRLDHADKIIEECDKYQVKLFVVKQNRFNLPIIKLKEAINAERFGKLTLGTIRLRWCRPQSYYDSAAWRGTWEFDGGVLTNQASHHIDLLQWLMGDVYSVVAKSTRALAQIEAEDTAVVILKFKNGALGIIEATTATRPKDLEGSLSVLGEKGSVVVGGFSANKLETWEFTEMTDEDNDVINKFNENPAHEFGYAHKAYYDHVVDCINNKKQQLVDGLSGRKSIEIITAIYESIETGKEIKLSFEPKRCMLGIKKHEL